MLHVATKFQQFQSKNICIYHKKTQHIPCLARSDYTSLALRFHVMGNNLDNEMAHHLSEILRLYSSDTDFRT